MTVSIITALSQLQLHVRKLARYHHQQKKYLKICSISSSFHITILQTEIAWDKRDILVSFFKSFRVIHFHLYWYHFKQIKNWQQNMRHEVSPKCSFKFITSSWSRCTSSSSFHVEFCEDIPHLYMLFTAVVTGTPGSPHWANLVLKILQLHSYDIRFNLPGPAERYTTQINRDTVLPSSIWPIQNLLPASLYPQCDFSD